MTDQPENLPTFPAGWWDEIRDADDGTPSGMSMRDWFAGRALAGWVLAGVMAAAGSDDDDELRRIAEECYKYADAMLAERAKSADA